MTKIIRDMHKMLTRRRRLRDIFDAVSGNDFKGLGDALQQDPLLACGREKGTYNTLLHWTATYRQRLLIEPLLTAGADVNAVNKIGRTPLFAAVGHDWQTVARDLIAAGAALDHKDKNGTTPLMHAMRCSTTRMALFLLDAGANPALTDNDGKTAADLARGSGLNAQAGALEAAIQERAEKAAREKAAGEAQKMQALRQAIAQGIPAGKIQRLDLRLRRPGK
jgi:hypothetical protein